MSGCAHMNPREVCGSCAPARYAEMRAALEGLYGAWTRAESNRGCYSCAPSHDARCEKDRKISDRCTCGRDELAAAGEAADKLVGEIA